MLQFNRSWLKSKQPQGTVVFRQMEYDLEGGLYGFAAIGIGVLACIGGVVMICQAEYMGILACVLGMLFLGIGFPLSACYAARIKITGDEVILTLGPVILRKMPVTEVRTLAYSTLTPNFRGEPWSTEVIVLSRDASSQMRYYARRWVQDHELPADISQDEKEKLILKKSVEKYIKSRTPGFHLMYEMGIWLEYSPEREEKLKELFPYAECFLD